MNDMNDKLLDGEVTVRQDEDLPVLNKYFLERGA